jgi:putative flippase GtrA
MRTTIGAKRSRAKGASRLQRLRRRLPASFAPFIVVGFSGLGVDLGGFAALERCGLPLPFARALSLPLAITTTWLLNRRFSFAPSGRHPAAEALRYFAAAGASQSTNYAVTLLIVGLIPTVPHILAAAIGSATAMVVSYVGFRFFAFAKATPPSS